MQCPKCHFEPVPEGASECPNCHAPMPAGRSVQVDVRAQQNLGTLIGVQAGQINGDVYGSNIVYVLSAAGRAAGSGSFFQKSSLPYKALAAYTARDSLIFKGRERETAQLVGRISEQAVLTLYGPSGVGKTSLLAAGAIPRLTEAGAAVVPLRDSQRPLADSLRDGLAACAREAPIPLPAQGDLAAVVKAVRDGLQGTLVLILDQAETLLDGRAGVGAELARALDAVDWQYLRIIFAVRESELPKLDGLRADLPDVLRNSLPLFALDTSQAREAIRKIPRGGFSRRICRSCVTGCTARRARTTSARSTRRCTCSDCTARMKFWPNSWRNSSGSFRRHSSPRRDRCWRGWPTGPAGAGARRMTWRKMVKNRRPAVY